MTAYFKHKSVQHNRQKPKLYLCPTEVLLFHSFCSIRSVLWVLLLYRPPFSLMSPASKPSVESISANSTWCDDVICI